MPQLFGHALEVRRKGIKNRIQLVALRATGTPDSSTIDYSTKGSCESLGDDAVLEASFIECERCCIAKAILDLLLKQYQHLIEVFIQGFYKIGHGCYDHSEVEPEPALADGNYMVRSDMTVACPNVGSTKCLSNLVE